MTRDDPRLTAFALGDLDEASRAEVEAILARDPGLRAEVESIRAAADSLRGALESEPVTALDPSRRAAIEAAAAGRGRIHRLRPSVGVAAAVLLVAGLSFATWGTYSGGTAVRESLPPATFSTPQGEIFMPEEAKINVKNNIRWPWSGPKKPERPAAPPSAMAPPKAPAAGTRENAQGEILLFRGQRANPGDRVGRLADRDLAHVNAEINASGKIVRDSDGKPTALYAEKYGALSLADPEEPSTDSFDSIVENPWIRPAGEAALSTFSIDVDTAAYAIMRRCLAESRLPPRGVVRIEELVNYFRYRYEGPSGEEPFAVRVDAAACPWEPRHRLVRIALKGREVEEAVRPAANLVFLLDVSGSMNQPNKLPLVKQSIALLAERLTARDRVAMVVYAGHSGLVLPSTPGDRRDEILAALERLQAGGSTNGGAGIELAYRVATENFIPGGINRVLLATDGDFNVGVTNRSDLVDLIEKKAKSRVFLTALGYGMGNLKDSTLESLADKGNGNYGYIDSLAEARKVLVEEGMSTLQTIAKDVKIQVEWNPAKVAGYRLLGYENRMLAARDFLDDAKDAGEIGAGHTVTALYEVVPAGEPLPGATVEALRYQRPSEPAGSEDLLTVKLRWKEPEGDVSRGMEQPFLDTGLAFDAAPEDFRFAAAVAAFGLVLRDSANKGSASLSLVTEIAAGALGPDENGLRKEFLGLVEKASTLKR